MRRAASSNCASIGGKNSKCDEWRSRSRRPNLAFQPLLSARTSTAELWADAPGGKDDWTVADNRLTFSKPDKYQHGLWSTKRFKDFELKFQAKLDGTNGELEVHQRSDP